MKRAMGTAALGLLFLMRAGAQDTPGETTPDDAKTQLKAALETSAKHGGFKFEGAIDQSNALGVSIPGIGESGPEGKFSGWVSASGVIALKMETSKGTYELFRRGDKVVQRQTWTGKQEMIGSFAHEVVAALSLSKLLEGAEKAKAVKKGDSKTIDGEECVALCAQLSPDLIGEDDDSGAVVKIHLLELKRVDVTVFVGKEETVRRVDICLTRGPSAMMRMGAGMEDDEEGDKKGEEEEEPQGPAAALRMFKVTSKLSVTLSGYDSNLKVEIPDDVKKCFRE